MIKKSVLLFHGGGNRKKYTREHVSWEMSRGLVT